MVIIKKIETYIWWVAKELPHWTAWKTEICAAEGFSFSLRTDFRKFASKWTSQVKKSQTKQLVTAYFANVA